MKIWMATTTTALVGVLAQNFVDPVSAGISCSALAAGGLGSHEAYTAGAIEGLIEAGADWDVTTFNGPSIVTTQALISDSAADFASNLKAAFSDVKSSEIYKSWFGGINTGYKKRGGLFNDSPSRSYYKSQLENAKTLSSRTVIASMTSLSTGLMVQKNATHAATVDDTVDILQASACNPGTFAPVEIEGDYYVTGAVRMNANVFSAVHSCRELGAADADITVDVVLTSAATIKDVDPSGFKTLSVQSRSTDIKDYIAALRDVQYAKIAYPHVNWRYLVIPETTLSQDKLDYSEEVTSALLSQGAADAATAVTAFSAHKECDPTTEAPSSCGQDQDCRTWASRNCFDATIPLKGRCLTSFDSKTKTTSGTCSFDSEEIESHRLTQFNVTSSLKQRADGIGNGKCIAAAISGGGDRGAYEAGLVQGLVDALPPTEVEWSVLTGISVGSILSTGMAKYPIGQEEVMAKENCDLATSLQKSDIFTDWVGGIISGTLFHSGIYDTAPELAFLKEQFPQSSPPTGDLRVMTIGAANMGNASYKLWHFNGAIGSDLVTPALMASSAIPGGFPLVKDPKGNAYYSDGGVIVNIDVFNTVVQCRDLGFADEDIVVDVLLTAGHDSIEESVQTVAAYTTEEVVTRCNAISDYDEFMAVAKDGIDAYPLVNWRCQISPSQDLPGDGISFDPDDMQFMVNLGIQDAKNAVAAGCASTDSNGNADALPKSCNWDKAEVKCTIDKDCYNWAIDKCHNRLSESYCKPPLEGGHNYCVFHT